MKSETSWWKNCTRAIQTNLQVKDTGLIDPDKLAMEIENASANVLIFNVGGIYAWYQSKVKYHHVNEYLPQNRDLLKEVIDACHARNIRFVGRFDFSKTDDAVYLEHPDWFARKPDAQPQIIGAQRPGPWSLLYFTCINSPYWNEAVAMPILSEALSQYDMDGVFFNATFPPHCWCDNCRRKYTQSYGIPMPEKVEEQDPSWNSLQLKDNITKLDHAIKEARPDIPLILYYWDEQTSYIKEPLSETICDESQNILSRGLSKLSPEYNPSIRMKLCNLSTDGLPPFGIIHSSPGMDWRHVGLPPAEYDFWLSQVPANGGSVWHSLTGVPATMPDKRIFEHVKRINEKIKLIEPDMTGAIPYAQVALLWDRNGSNDGWLKALFNNQIPFGLIEKDMIKTVSLSAFKAIVIPEGFAFSKGNIDMLAEYVRLGGNLLIEGRLPEDFPELFELCGIEKQQTFGENLIAAYLRFEDSGLSLRAGGMEDTPMIAFRGRVAYSNQTSATTLTTLVPPFAPLEAVGAPPERASILVPQTNIPLCLENKYGQGHVISLTFNLSSLIMEFGLSDHLLLAANLINRSIGTKFLEITHYPGIYVSVFKRDDMIILHLINGAGPRPLTAFLPLHNIHIKLHLESNVQAVTVRGIISKTDIRFEQNIDDLTFVVDMTDVWDTIEIRTK